MTMRLSLVCVQMGSLVLALCTAPALATDVDWVGPNRLANPEFEIAGEQGLPQDWAVTSTPVGSAKYSLDQQIFLVGKTALKAEVSDTGVASVSAQPVPVEGGKWYLVSLGYRTTGFGEPGKYSGVDAYVSVTWHDTAGKQIGSSPGLSFPYHPVDWDLGDRFVRAPTGAAQLRLTVSLNNHSQQQTGKNIPSVLWLDGCQVRQYNPPPTPEWALQKVPRIVEGGLSTSRVQAYQLSNQNMAGGKWSSIVSDPQATYDSAVSSPEGVAHGIMAHSPYFTNAPPGLYRVLLRSKVASNTGGIESGSLDVFSEYASTRAELHLFPQDFATANTYDEFSVDFVLRSAGYWGFRVYTQGNQSFTADIVKVFRLAPLQDKQLLELYPGSEGAIPADVQPRREAYPFRGLLVAGAMYDYYRIVDAHHLTGYDMHLRTIPIRKGRSQVYVGFPATAQELFDHNVIYLCGADLTALTLRQKNMLSEYVRRGGGLIVFGGHKALDRAGLQGSLLEDVVPVVGGAGIPPLVALPGGAPLTRGVAHPVTQFADFDASTVCFFVHDVQARPEAQTLITVGGKPSLVVGACGKGRVAVIGMTCFGSPGESQTPFWQWRSWVLLLRDLAWWVAGQDEHFLP
ncbi:MAG: glutamine amidotransferase [Pirellulaceae bacterium]